MDSTEEIIGILMDVVRESSLSDDDKNLWYTAFVKMEPVYLGFLRDAWAGGAPDMEEATKMLKRKIDALKNPSRDQWDAILNEEEETLKRTLTS